LQHLVDKFAVFWHDSLGLVFVAFLSQSKPNKNQSHLSKSAKLQADAIGIREVHLNTAEGMGTLLRNFMRPFRGVHKKFLAGYLALCEFPIHLKRITPDFSAAFVALHPPLT